MNLNIFTYLVLIICVHKVSSLYPSDRLLFPINGRERSEDILSDPIVNPFDDEIISSSPTFSSDSPSPANLIRESQLVRFVDYSSILGSPLASLSSPSISVESTPLIRRDKPRNGSSSSTKPSNYTVGKSIICNEETVESLFPIVSITRHDSDPKSKETARHRIMVHFWKYGLETYAQKFGTGNSGVNLIGIWPGKNRNKTGDSIIVVGGHYDTVRGTHGIDDNGSGVVALLELVRLIGTAKLKLDHTIFFVAFDLEETGLYGSQAFVSYLIHEELLNKRANFLGAYITDMILTWDPTEGTQALAESFLKETPEAASKVRKNKNRGDFASIWMRRGLDKSIWEPLEKSWNRIANSTKTGSKYKLIAFDPQVPDKTTLKKKESRDTLQTFLRSDHSSFWFHGNSKIRPLNALLITDLGPWRGYQKSCYHRACDDLSQLNPDKLGFMVHIILTLHDVITINPPTITTNNRRRESSSPIPSGYPFPRKPTTLTWPLDRRYIDFDGLYNNNRGFTDLNVNNNWLPGASDHRFISTDPRSNWNGNRFYKSWPTIRPSIISSSSTPSTSSSQASSSNPPSSPLPAYDVSEFNSRTFTNPWYTLINRRF